MLPRIALNRCTFNLGDLVWSSNTSIESHPCFVYIAVYIVLYSYINSYKYNRQSEENSVNREYIQAKLTHRNNSFDTPRDKVQLGDDKGTPDGIAGTAGRHTVM